MIGYRITNGFLDFANTVFTCPHCNKQYDDADDKYINRCNKNKKIYTTIKCSCGNKFGMTYDYMGDTHGFKLK